MAGGRASRKLSRPDLGGVVILKKILLALGALLGLAVAVAFWLDIPRFVIGLNTYGRQAREGTLGVGDPAPVVSVYELDGVSSRELSEWTVERPLVLIFGSFT